MGATKVGIVYSLAQRKRRWIVVPDSDAELPLKILLGEGYIEQPLDDYRKRGADAAVTDAAGGQPLSDRCAMIDKTSAVVGIISADPAIDTIEAHSLVASDIALAGDILQAGVFLRRFVLLDQTGLVTAVVTVDATQPPIAAPGGSIAADLTSEVGDIVAVTRPISLSLA